MLSLQKAITQMDRIILSLLGHISIMYSVGNAISSSGYIKVSYHLPAYIEQTSKDINFECVICHYLLPVLEKQREVCLGFCRMQ